MAIVQIAVHDALNAIEPRYPTYAYHGAAPGAAPAAAVPAATRDNLVRLLPPATAAVEAAYAARLATVPDGPTKAAGIAAGRTPAAAILPRRDADDPGAAIGMPCTAGAPAPAVYQPT